MRKILFLDQTHPLLKEELTKAGFVCDEDYTSDYRSIIRKIAAYEGVIIRSRISLDKELLEAATRLRFIARAGAGLENIDTEYAAKKSITVLNAPEGNRNAVGEHTLGLLLSLLNKIPHADRDIRAGFWRREAHRGVELDGKTIGIIGYGNMGKAFSRKLSGFDVEVLCYDILPGLGDAYARQVSLDELQAHSDILSLHMPINESSRAMVDTDFINAFAKNFYLLNTARGEVVVTRDLVDALKRGKILGAGLDVLEYEKKSFESFFDNKALPEEFDYLLKAENVVLSPHVAGWTVESKEKIARTLWEKIKRQIPQTL